jgi:ADP-ribose pyrophosphatase YjhB (NUDIX family)
MPTDLYKKEDHLLLAVDCIIFGFDGSRLKALLVKRNLEPGLGKWSLMGGFVKKSESVKEAATRVLNLLTGLTDVYMEELGCFGNVNRDPGGRVVSIAFFALIKINDYSESLMKEHNSKWFETDHLPALIFDHGEMIAQAKEKLKEKVSAHPAGFTLLPRKFTLQQLQGLYEAIYEKKMDKRNLTRRILELGILKKLDEKEKESSRKGAFLYVFEKNKYEKLAKKGFRII